MVNIYSRLIDAVIDSGIKTAPRGLHTIELLRTTVVSVRSGELWLRSGIMPACGYIEGLCIITGDDANDHLKKVMDPNIVDEYFGKSTKYAQKVGTQLDTTVKRLEKDPETRRAVVVLARENDDDESSPCTVSAQFKIRAKTQNGITVVNEIPYMHTTVYMRSWDIIRGVPNDITLWSVVNQYIAWKTNTEPGIIEFVSPSIHLYVEDADKYDNFRIDKRWIIDWDLVSPQDLLNRAQKVFWTDEAISIEDIRTH